MKEKQSSIKKLLAIIFVVIIFIVFFLIASLPFSPLRILVSIMLTISGFIIPFVSIKTTWWLYTLGGIQPLPEQHKWLAKYVNYKDESKVGYKDYVQRLSYIAIPLAMIFTQIAMSGGYDSLVLLGLKLLSLFIIFGLGLTLGTAIKKRNFH